MEKNYILQHVLVSSPKRKCVGPGFDSSRKDQVEERNKLYFSQAKKWGKNKCESMSNGIH